MDFPIPDFVTTWQFWLSAILCYLLCEGIKEIPRIPGWVINIANLVFGALIYPTITLSWWFAPAFLYGILAASVSTLAWETFSNILKSINRGGE